MRNIIIDLQDSNTWKIQLRTAISFIPSKDVNEERAMHSRIDNIEFTFCNAANEVIDITSFKVSRKFRNNNERK